MKVVYVAGRFTAATPWETEQNVRRAEAVGLEVAQLGAAPMIPHSNTRFFVGTVNPEFWYAATLALLLKSDAVVMVPGWEASKGATAEMAAAVAAGIPVFHRLIDLAGWLTAAKADDADPAMPPPDVIEAMAKACGCCRECQSVPCAGAMAGACDVADCRCDEPEEDREDDFDRNACPGCGGGCQVACR